MLNTITDDYIKTVLSKHQDLLAAIHERILELYQEMEDSDEVIKSATFGGAHENIGGGRSSDKKELTDIMLRHFALLKAQSQEIRLEMTRLVEEEETINRIWCCFRVLDKDIKQILTELYVRGRPYKEVEYEAQKHDISRTTFERLRKSGFEEIKKLYASSMSNIDIITNTQYKKGLEKKKKEYNQHAVYQQISLNMLMENKKKEG